MINLCKAKTKLGKPCGAQATATGLCFFHEHPDRASELGRKGGLRNRHVTQADAVDLPPLRTAEDVRAMLAQLAVDVRNRKVEPRVATSLSQLASTLLKAIEVADLEARLTRLEGGTNGPEETN